MPHRKNLPFQLLHFYDGPDNYPGVPCGNSDGRKLLMGWMSNWEFANDVTAYTWRSGMTIVRELELTKAGDKWLLTSTPASEINKASQRTVEHKTFELANEVDLATVT
jgi:fructan beta-fructosidase